MANSQRQQQKISCRCSYLSCDRVRSGGIYGRLFTAPLATSLTSTHSCHSISEEGEGDFYFDEEEVLGGLDEEARAALLARQAAGMDLEEAEGELLSLIHI